LPLHGNHRLHCQKALASVQAWRAHESANAAASHPDCRPVLSQIVAPYQRADLALPFSVSPDTGGLSTPSLSLPEPDHPRIEDAALGTCVTEEHRAEKCSHAQECRLRGRPLSAPAIGVNPENGAPVVCHPLLPLVSTADAVELSNSFGLE
jgi:hypothetical protein